MLIRPLALGYSLDAPLLDAKSACEALDLGIRRVAILEALARDGARLVGVGGNGACELFLAAVIGRRLALDVDIVLVLVVGRHLGASLIKGFKGLVGGNQGSLERQGGKRRRYDGNEVLRKNDGLKRIQGVPNRRMRKSLRRSVFTGLRRPNTEEAFPFR